MGASRLLASEDGCHITLRACRGVNVDRPNRLDQRRAVTDSDQSVCGDLAGIPGWRMGLMAVTIALSREDAMGAAEVTTMFRAAMANDDAHAMRRGIEALFGLTDGAGLSAEDEFEVRHPEYVMEMPQTGERIRGRDAMRAMQEAFPAPPSITLRRVTGAGRVWVIEGVNNYGNDDVWHVVAVFELDDEGRIVRDTRYYTQQSDPPEWRAPWVEPIG
jgi:hypothetical protein